MNSRGWARAGNQQMLYSRGRASAGNQQISNSQGWAWAGKQKILNSRGWVWTGNQQIVYSRGRASAGNQQILNSRGWAWAGNKKQLENVVFSRQGFDWKVANTENLKSKYSRLSFDNIFPMYTSGVSHFLAQLLQQQPAKSSLTAKNANPHQHLLISCLTRSQKTPKVSIPGSVLTTIFPMCTSGVSHFLAQFLQQQPPKSRLTAKNANPDQYLPVYRPKKSSKSRGYLDRLIAKMKDVSGGMRCFFGEGAISPFTTSSPSAESPP